MKLDVSKIERFRKKKGWSYTDLAKALNMSKQLLSYTIKHQSISKVSDFAIVMQVGAKTLIME